MFPFQSLKEFFAAPVKKNTCRVYSRNLWPMIRRLTGNRHQLLRFYIYCVMAIRSTDTLKEGMQLDAPIKNAQGQVLFGVGHILKAKHIDMLMAWGIQEADVALGEEDDEAAQKLKQQIALFEERLKPLFLRCDLSHPVIIETIRCVAERQVQKLHQTQR